MKTAPIKKTSILFLFSILIFLQISCNKKDDDYIEFTQGLSMDPKSPRFGIKIKGDNYVYYCEELMNLDINHNNHHTGKYKFYKSEEKVDFKTYKELILENFQIQSINHTSLIEDATLEQINVNFESNNNEQFFHLSNLNSQQLEIYNRIWKLKNQLKFKKSDSILFNQILLQVKLPEPPPIN